MKIYAELTDADGNCYEFDGTYNDEDGAEGTFSAYQEDGSLKEVEPTDYLLAQVVKEYELQCAELDAEIAEERGLNRLEARAQDRYERFMREAP